MPNATLKFDGREIRIGEDLTTIGRASDNTISFSGDSNVSRYHAEIENRGSGFYLIELGSSNGTAINGERITSEKMLDEGDVITLGNSATIEFYLDKELEQKSETPSTNNETVEENSAVSEKTEIAEDSEKVSKFPTGLAIAGAACGLALVFVVGAILFSFDQTTSSSGCKAKASITNIENFDVLRETKQIEVELEDDDDCASRAIFLLNDKVLAVSEEKPFTAAIDPNKFPDLANGGNNSLKVILEDDEGKRIQQSEDILLVLETRAIATPKPEITETIEPDRTPTPKPTIAPKGKVTPAEAQVMVENLIKSMGGSGHKINKDFIEKVLAKTNDYTNAGGYSAKAQNYQDLIKTAYTVNTDVGSPLGFLTAMSRTKFNPGQGTDIGLWRMSNDFATQNALTSACGNQTLNDADCAAKASANYTKNLLRTVFDNDPVYTVAAYGMPLGDAYNWKISLQGDRADFWNAIKTPAQRDELVNFFAAGIVADNPQKFGLKDDRPISSFY